MSSPSLFIAQLFRDYLSTPESQAAGVPSTLPITVMDSARSPDFPALVIAAKEEKSHGLCKAVDVDFLLLTWLRASPAVADGGVQTTREQASQWLHAIDSRLQDTASLKSWLATLPDDRLQNWTFRKNISYHGEQAPMRDKDQGTVFYALSLTCQLWWERTV